MAAPTMQPVKNLAFIKCGSFMEYDCLPAYLKGPDQFVFADIPSSRPSYDGTGLMWCDSTDPDFPAANGWTMIVDFENDHDVVPGEWTYGTMYIGYWNTNTNEHSSKKIKGAMYSSFFGTTYNNTSAQTRNISIPYSGASKIYLTDTNIDVYPGGAYVFGGTYSGSDGYRLTAASTTVGNTFVCGVASNNPAFVTVKTYTEESEDSVFQVSIYKAEGSFTLFASDPDTSENIGSITDTGSISALPTLVAEDYGFDSSDGWVKVPFSGMEEILTYDSRTITQSESDGYEYEFGAVITSNASITGFYHILGSQWDEDKTTTGSTRSVASISENREAHCKIYKFNTWEFIDVLYSTVTSLSFGYDRNNCRTRGSALFYRKRATETGKMLKNIVAIDPFYWKASRTNPTRANRAEITAPTNRPLRLVAARVTKDYDSSATSAPATTYTEMRFGNIIDGSDSKYKTINNLISGTTSYWQKYGALDNGVKLLGSHETPNIWMTQSFKIVEGSQTFYNYFNAWKTSNVTINSSNATYSTFSSDNVYTYGIMYTLRQFVRNSRRKTIKFIHSRHNSTQVSAGLFETGVKVPESKYIIVDWYSSSDPTGFIELYYSTVESPSLIAADFEAYAHICEDKMTLLKSYNTGSGVVKERKITYFVDSEDPTHKYCVFIVPNHSVPTGGTDKLLLVTSDASLTEACISVADNQLADERAAAGVKLHDNETVYEVSYDLLM